MCISSRIQHKKDRFVSMKREREILCAKANKWKEYAKREMLRAKKKKTKRDEDYTHASTREDRAFGGGGLGEGQAASVRESERASLRERERNRESEKEKERESLKEILGDWKRKTERGRQADWQTDTGTHRHLDTHTHTHRDTRKHLESCPPKMRRTSCSTTVVKSDILSQIRTWVHVCMYV